MTVSAWCALLSCWVFAVGLVVGTLVGLPGWSAAVLRHGAADVALTTVLAILLLGPTAYLASAARGYLAPLGFAILTIFLAQITAATGWGAWFPWSVPALFSGLAGPRAGLLDARSCAVVVLTSAAGVIGTFVWWRRADHTT